MNSHIWYIFSKPRRKQYKDTRKLSCTGSKQTGLTEYAPHHNVKFVTEIN